MFVNFHELAGVEDDRGSNCDNFHCLGRFQVQVVWHWHLGGAGATQPCTVLFASCGRHVLRLTSCYWRGEGGGALKRERTQYLHGTSLCSDHQTECFDGGSVRMSEELAELRLPFVGGS